MARTATQQSIRNLALLYADMRPGGDTDQFVVNTTTSTYAGVNQLVNLACAEFYDLVVAAAGPERFLTSTTISIVSGTNTYALPATHLKTYGIVLEWGTQRNEAVAQYDDVTGYVAIENGCVWQENGRKAYRIQGSNIRIAPTPTSAVTARHWYVPAWVDFTHDTSDTKDFIDGWEKLPALRVAMELREIEQQPTGSLAVMLEREVKRVENLASERDDQPLRILDVSRRGLSAPYVESPDL